MSMRTALYAVTSLQPIRQAIASGDSKLVEALVELNNGDEDDSELDSEMLEELEEERHEFRQQAEGMILCEVPPASEPGSWCYLIQHLATYLELEMERLALDDWKHNYCWEPYRKPLSKLISPAAMSLLSHLENGRPLCGKKIADNGCSFAWLSAAETKELLQSLKAVPPKTFSNDEMQDFHLEIVESLEDAVTRNAEVFFTAT
jgi:hypothetical protein